MVLLENNAITLFYIFYLKKHEYSYTNDMTYRLLIASLATLAIVASCSPARDATNSKNTFQEQEIVINHLIKWEELLKQKEENYIVFVYSEKCGHCHDMMDEIITFAQDGILATYFVNTLDNSVPLSREVEVGINKIEDLSIVGTPTIIEVDKAVVTSNLAGIDDCLLFLNEKRMK